MTEEDYVSASDDQIDLDSLSCDLIPEKRSDAVVHLCSVAGALHGSSYLQIPASLFTGATFLPTSVKVINHYL